MKATQKGFTLIELMIVVAIIGILAAIAIPAYSNYQSRAKLSAGLAEASAGKTAFELKLNDGESVGAPSDIGLQTSTANCTMSTSASTIVCTIVNAPSQVDGAVITWTRESSTGEWDCEISNITGDASLAPKSCPAA